MNIWYLYGPGEVCRNTGSPPRVTISPSVIILPAIPDFRAKSSNVNVIPQILDLHVSRSPEYLLARRQMKFYISDKKINKKKKKIVTLIRKHRTREGDNPEIHQSPSPGPVCWKTVNITMLSFPCFSPIFIYVIFRAACSRNRIWLQTSFNFAYSFLTCILFFSVLVFCLLAVPCPVHPHQCEQISSSVLPFLTFVHGKVSSLFSFDTDSVVARLFLVNTLRLAALFA